ncbi:MAG: hypothetical protein GVY36_09610 [Verrucomicrobia bacterium]|jgi:hypothetical protein|nr:hypothetical protein [Verrucomicrobiota bacterium]
MLRRVSKISLLIFCGWLLTGPLALLQLGAWSWMLASYSQESSFQQAIIDTFGDERPCDLCKVIDAVEKSDDTSRSALNSKQKDLKLMLGLGRAIQIFRPTSAESSEATIVCEPENAHRAVPTPPPRVA